MPTGLRNNASGLVATAAGEAIKPGVSASTLGSATHGWDRLIFTVIGSTTSTPVNKATAADWYGETRMRSRLNANGLGVERGAVMERHALAHGQRPAQPVLRLRERFGEPRLDAAIEVVAHQTVVERVVASRCSPGWRCCRPGRARAARSRAHGHRATVCRTGDGCLGRFGLGVDRLRRRGLAAPRSDRGGFLSRRHRRRRDPL